MQKVIILSFFTFVMFSFGFAQKSIETTISLSNGQKVDIIYDSTVHVALPGGVSLVSLENSEYFVFYLPLFYGEYEQNYQKLQNLKEKEIILHGTIPEKRSSFDAFITFADDFSYYDVYCKTLTGVIYGQSRIYKNGKVAMKTNKNMKKVIQQKQYSLLAQNWNHTKLIDIYWDYLNRIYALM